jgi:hypothetical protein
MRVRSPLGRTTPVDVKRRLHRIGGEQPSPCITEEIMSPVEVYGREVRRKFGFRANWLPNAACELGDVGLLAGQWFQRHTDLGRLGIGFDTRSGTAGSDLYHTSGTGTVMRVKLAGEALAGSALPIETAGAAISFSSAGAFIFQATAPLQTEIDNLHSIGREIAVLLQKGSWQPSWCVVVATVRVSGLTVLVSQSSTSALELSTSGGFGPAATPLVTQEGRLELRRQAGELTTILSNRGAVPMFHLARLKRSIIERLWGRSPTFGRASGSASLDSPRVPATEWFELVGEEVSQSGDS